MSCEYVRDYYKVPACIGRRVKYKDKGGIIAKDGGNYIAVNFDDEKPGVTINIHPTDPNLAYLEMGVVRQMTRSQKNYQDYLDADCGFSFATWMGFMSKEGKERRERDLMYGVIRPKYEYSY